MSRMVGRPRPRGGKGIGERLSEIAVYIVLIGAAAYGLNWYFNVYRKSPGPPLQGYVSNINAGRPEEQWKFLASSTKQVFGSEKQYRSKWPLAHGLSARVANFVITKITVQGNTAYARVTMTIRKPSTAVGDPGALLQAGTDQFVDSYVMRREPDGWKVVLEKSNLTSIKTASNADVF